MTNALEQRLVVKLRVSTATFGVEILLQLMTFRCSARPHGSPLLSLFHMQVHVLHSFKEKH